MNWISNWLYENAILCRLRGWWFKVRFRVGSDEGPYEDGGLFERGRFHENVTQHAGAMAEGGEMVCQDCGKHIFL